MPHAGRDRRGLNYSRIVPTPKDRRKGCGTSTDSRKRTGTSGSSLCYRFWLRNTNSRRRGEEERQDGKRCAQKWKVLKKHPAAKLKFYRGLGDTASRSTVRVSLAISGVLLTHEPKPTCGPSSRRRQNGIQPCGGRAIHWRLLSRTGLAGGVYHGALEREGGEREGSLLITSVGAAGPASCSRSAAIAAAREWRGTIAVRIPVAALIGHW